MNKYKFLVSIALIALLAGCTGIIKGSIAEEKITSIEKIGVVSLLTNEFRNTLIGTTIFNNKYDHGDVSDWNIDEFAANYAKDKLDEAGRFDVGVADLGAETYDTLYERDGRFLVNLDVLLPILKAQGYDTALVLRTAGHDNYPHHDGGFGLLQRSAFGSSNQCIYVLFTIEAFDVQTGKTLGWQRQSPCVKGGTIQWKEFDQYSRDELASMKSSVRHELIRLIPANLRDLDLIED